MNDYMGGMEGGMEGGYGLEDWSVEQSTLPEDESAIYGMEP